MIDLHAHLLPGVDDGASTWEESLAIARTAAEDGITMVAATPHVRDDYDTAAATMEGLVARLRLELERHGVPLQVRPGGEVALDRLRVLAGHELRRFGLGGNPRYLLVEFPYYGWPLALDRDIEALLAQGITPVLAHPERNADVQLAPERLRRAVEAGALVQLTAASFAGRMGARCRETALDLLERQLAHVLASDAHAPEVRGIGLSSAAAALEDEALAEWLTLGVPGAIVAGEPLPGRPSRTRSRGRSRLGRRRFRVA
jgi:protein-tyrosine phosphatase